MFARFVCMMEAMMTVTAVGWNHYCGRRDKSGACRARSLVIIHAQIMDTTARSYQQTNLIDHLKIKCGSFRQNSNHADRNYRRPRCRLPTSSLPHPWFASGFLLYPQLRLRRRGSFNTTKGPHVQRIVTLCQMLMDSDSRTTMDNSLPQAPTSAPLYTHQEQHPARFATSSISR